MAPTKSSAGRHDKEIEALLNRLHSGCRFVAYEDDSSSKKGKGSRTIKHHDISTQLRNSSPPDETHAELGRALAHSYIASLQSISAHLQSSSEDQVVQDAVERGDHIIQSLCCGDIGNSDGNEIGQKFMSNRSNYASAGCAFFGCLLPFFMGTDEKDVPVKSFIKHQWQGWCIRCEEFSIPEGGIPSVCNGGGINVLNSCLKNYGVVCNQPMGKKEAENGVGCAKVYDSLKHHSSRKYLIRICVASAFSSDSNGIGLVSRISSLFHSCILKARKATTQSFYHAERQLLLQEVMRGISTLLQEGSMVEIDNTTSRGGNGKLIDEIVGMIRYLTTSLISYLDQSIYASFSMSSSHSDQQNERNPCLDIFELGHDWLRELCYLMSKLVLVDGRDVVRDGFCASIEGILTTILPQFTPSLMTSTIDMAPIYSSLISCISALPQDKLFSVANTTVTLRLGSLTLMLQDDTEVQHMCDLMFATMKCLDQADGLTGSSSSNLFIGGMLTSLGCVFRCRPSCFDSATQLAKLGESILQNTQNQNHGFDEDDGVHLMDAIKCSMDSDCLQSLMSIISMSISGIEPPSTPLNQWHRRPLTLSEQGVGVLLGLSMLHISISSSQSITLDQALVFLRSFLDCYPRMASRVVPSIIGITRLLINSQTSTNPPLLLAPIEFLASSCIASDPHGAHLAWSFLSSLAGDGVPTAVRSAVIRQLPDMCMSNKRLFRRIRDVVGKSMVAQDPIIRVTATAALSYMANLDLLRDVEQIVGWVQNRLTDEEPAVVYYALETLRYLVVNEELEFDLVVRVLEKRLDVDLSDPRVVLGLDKLMLESLFALMGEGGLEEEDSDEEDSNDEGMGGPAVSPQSVKAVNLLVDLALSPELAINEVNMTTDASNARLQRSIYGALSSYSPQVLGLDAEVLRSWDGTETSKELEPEVVRFLRLKEIVLSGYDLAASINEMASAVGSEINDIADELLQHATDLGKTMLQFEEDCHGSFLFRGSNTSGRDSSSEKASKGKTDRTRVSKSALASLPTSDSIKDMFDSDPRAASATAILYSIGSSDALLQTEDVLSTITDCFGDMDNEPILDPAFQSIQLCSIIRCMDIVWKTIENVDPSVREELADQVVAQMEEWSETYGGGFAYIAMSAFSIAVDDSAQCWTSIAKIHDTILGGQDNYLFDSDDINQICLSMLAGRMASTADARVAEVIDMIEQYLSSHDRHTCFGAYFGLGIIASNLVKGGDINGTDPSDTWRRQQAQRITCMLLSAFNTCLTEGSDDVLELIASVKCSEVTADLSEVCSDLDPLFIRDGFAHKGKAVLIGLSHTFPLIGAMSGPLLKCLVGVLDMLPLGSGKGLVLNAAYKNAIESGVLEQKDVSSAISTISKSAQESSSDIGDALLALVSLCHLSSKVQKELDFVVTKCRAVLLGNDDHIGSEDKMMTILACFATVGELPIATFDPNMHAAAKKSLVVDVVNILNEIALNDAQESKYRDASTIGLGVLCAMSRISHSPDRSRQNAANKFENMTAKDGSALQGIFQQIEKAYSALCGTPENNITNRSAVAKHMCALFSTLEPIAMPGNFSRVIELALKESSNNEHELKDSSINLLVSQLSPKLRRIGYDGRGFVDLYTRLTRMSSNELNDFVGSNAITILMKAFPIIMYQIPTTMGEEMAKCLWAICCSNLRISLSTQSMVEFFAGMKTILTSVNQEGKLGSKQSISPALLRNLQKYTVAEIFSDLCSNAVPTSDISTENVWSNYLQCVELVPRGAVTDISYGPSGDVDDSNVFGMAMSAALSPKSTRKLESWIARQIIDKECALALRLPILTIANQVRNETEMKESVLGIFEIMVVKGVNTMALYLLAAKIAFWSESRQVLQLGDNDMPAKHVSNISSFTVTRNLCFAAHALPSRSLNKLFDSFVDDLPTRLAVLCASWKISDDILNRASRISYKDIRSDSMQSLKCINRIVKVIGGGEI